MPTVKVVFRCRYQPKHIGPSESPLKPRLVFQTEFFPFLFMSLPCPPPPLCFCAQCQCSLNKWWSRLLECCSRAVFKRLLLLPLTCLTLQCTLALLRALAIFLIPAAASSLPFIRETAGLPEVELRGRQCFHECVCVGSAHGGMCGPFVLNALCCHFSADSTCRITKGTYMQLK